MIRVSGPLKEKLTEGAAHPRLVDEKRVMAVPAVQYHWFVTTHTARRVTRYEPLLVQREQPVGFDADHEKRSR